MRPSKVSCYVRHGFDDKISSPHHKITRNDAFLLFRFLVSRPDVEKFRANSESTISTPSMIAIVSFLSRDQQMRKLRYLRKVACIHTQEFQVFLTPRFWFATWPYFAGLMRSIA